MRIIMFYHSLVSDWNHGNAHFLRGVVAELQSRGHDVRVYEPAGGWSLGSLRRFHGERPLREFRRRFPGLRSEEYSEADADLDRILTGADAVIVHEWNQPLIAARVAEHRRQGGGDYALLFHDTHHRVISQPRAMSLFDLSDFDGVLAFGNIIRDTWLQRGWARRAWTWHEAADTRTYHPLSPPNGRHPEYDLIWVGNWGDEERTAELQEFLIEPIRSLGLRARFHGVRYPDHALRTLDRAGIEYGGYLPAFQVAEVMANCRCTMHVPRRPYVEQAPGIPTIRVFEALACGTPLLCSPWEDSEHLFRPGRDYLSATSGRVMTKKLERLLGDRELRRSLSEQGLRTIQRRHTCAHRVDELETILDEIRARPRFSQTRGAAPPRAVVSVNGGPPDSEVRKAARGSATRRDLPPQRAARAGTETQRPSRGASRKEGLRVAS